MTRSSLVGVAPSPFVEGRRTPLYCTEVDPVEDRQVYGHHHPADDAKEAE